MIQCSPAVKHQRGGGRSLGERPRRAVDLLAAAEVPVVRARPVWRRAAASPLRPWRRFRGNGSVGTPDAKDISRDALTRARLCSLSCLSPARGGCEHEAEWAFKLQSDDEIQFKGQIAKFRFKTPSSRALSPRRSDSSNPCTRGARRTGCPRCTSSPRSPRRGSCCRRRP